MVKRDRFLDAKANLDRSDVPFSLLWMCLYNKGVTSHNTVLLEGFNRGFPDQTCVGMSQNQWPSTPIDLIDYFRSQFLGTRRVETHSLIDFA